MDLAAIKARMRAAREKWVKVGDLEFLVRRPNQIDFLRIAARGLDERQRNVEVVLDAVRDWRGMTEAILLGEPTGGISTPAAFDAEAFELYIGDHADMLLELAGAIGAMRSAQAEKDAEKKT